MSSFSEQFVEDFAKRTFQNLQNYCEKVCSDEKTVSFEITQLINSFLGCLIFPKEECCSNEQRVNKLKEKFPNEAIKNIYEKDRKLRMVSEKDGNFFEMVKNLRNAIAHGHITPVEKENLNIVEGFVFKNIAQGGVITAEYKLTNNHIFNILMYVLSITIDNTFDKTKAESLANELSKKSGCSIELNIDGVLP